MTFSYPGVQVRQRDAADAPELILFSAPAGEIVQWADIDRLNVTGEGVQRRRNEAKVRAITRFLAADPQNTIPSALTIALLDASLEQSSPECGRVTIKGLDEGGQALIIDGQHRLYGAEAFDPELQLNVVGIIDPTDLEIAFQFLVINNKATKVPTDHIRLLSINIDNEQLTNRLRSARMSLSKSAALVGIVDGEEESPFFHSVIWPVENIPSSDRRDLVRPAAIEIAIASIEQKELLGLDNDDALIAFFYALWDAIKSAWPELWIPDSRLLGKAGFVAMTQFLVDDLAPLVDRDKLDASNPDDVRNEVAEVVKDLIPEFWTVDWTMASLDTSAGRQLIVDELQRVRRNQRRNEPWYEGISLVTGASSESATVDNLDN